MPFTPEEAKKLNKELMKKYYDLELVGCRDEIDEQLKQTPNGTTIDSMKSCLDVVSKEYEQLGWYCRQYTKSYFHMELNYLEVSALPFTRNTWKEKILNFLRMFLSFNC